MNPQFTITHAITRGLARIERARGFLEAAQLSERWIREMSQRALLLEAHHTTHIEGTRLTLDQAEQLLQVLHSEPIRTRIIEKYNLMEHYEIDPEGKYPRTKLYEQFRSNINFRLTEFQ